MKTLKMLPLNYSKPCLDFSSSPAWLPDCEPFPTSVVLKKKRYFQDKYLLLEDMYITPQVMLCEGYFTEGEGYFAEDEGYFGEGEGYFAEGEGYFAEGKIQEYNFVWPVSLIQEPQH